MGLFGGRPTEQQKAIVRFRAALRASGGKFTMQQIAYGTYMAQAADRPLHADYLRSVAENEPMSTAERAAIDAVLSEAGVG